MNPSVAFGIVNNVALAGWLFLLFFPKWKYTIPLITTTIIFSLAVFYSCLIVTCVPNMKPDMFNSLANVRLLFQSDTMLLAGWIHYLAFDLFVGVYIVRQAAQLKISRWIVAIILPFTFLFGPLGYAIFQTIVSVKARSQQ